MHVTMDTAGQSRFGPDAEYVEAVDYSFEIKANGLSNAIRDWYPGRDETRLHAGFVGVRPNLQGPGEGRQDFILSGRLNMASRAWSTCLESIHPV